MRLKDLLSKEKYDQFSVEKEVKEFWEREKVYEQLRKRSGRKFYFLDGPPYASAKSIHIGTAWNKVIKDVVIRYHRMTGHSVWDKPGFDTHGLPIEVKIEQSLGIKSKKEIQEKVGIDKFVEACKAFVRDNMEAMSRQFSEIGASLDWSEPYVTYENSYIESGWWLIKRAHERGLLYKGYRVLHWCPRCETVLADYEVSEYRDLEDPSIYVKFPLRGRRGEHLLIWTTTPWTIPANVFVMAHPELEYARVKVGEEVLIIAKARLEEVMKEAGIESYEVLEVLPGRALEGVEYDHPLEDLVEAQRELRQYHKVVMAPEGVTAYEGTGLVHAASGHGSVDSEVAARLGIPIVSLVDEVGRMTREAGKYSGMHFRDEANRVIVDDLRQRGSLFHAARIVHRYPVCWRCKTPLALRATEQWFIAVTRLKKELVEEASKVEWVPDWARTRFMNMVEEVRDWAISRQRFWGIPLPIWVCKRCKKYHVVGSVRELEELGGEVPQDLHRPWIDRVKIRCPHCEGEAERVPDVLDVWFDSGVAFYASLGYPRNRELYERLEPVDFIVEGHDQTRGWFFSLLRSGIIGFGKSPYRRVLVHGFALDEQGREMHKSLGNYVDFEELISKVPRDVVRLWLMSSTVWEDLRFSWKGLEHTAKDFTVFWNTFVFASTYMSLDSFDPEESSLESVEAYLEPLDRWLISRTRRLVAEYHKAMNALRLHDAARALRAFLLEDVSRFYVRLIRRRVWEERDTPSKRAAYATLYYALRTWLLLAAPFIPFFTEYIYQRFVKIAEKDAPLSVHMLPLPAPEGVANEELERSVALLRELAEEVLALRATAGIKLRRPVSRVIVVPKREEVASALRALPELFGELVNVKRVELESEAFLESLKAYSVKPVLGEIGKDFKKLSREVVKVLEARGAEIARALATVGYYELELNGERVRLERRHVELLAEYPEWLVVKDSELAVVALDKRIREEEEVEGYAREVIRRAQHMRKEARLNIEDKVILWVQGDEEMVSAVRRLEDFVKNEVRAVEIRYSAPEEGAFSEEWEVDDKKFLLGIKRA
ncbi:MAG: isoleucine--tRNA ligase [Acidilobaceae archaeon]|nr:isoleucine--tRNA ligase [Acidilobaceae archaeon]